MKQASHLEVARSPASAWTHDGHRSHTRRARAVAQLAPVLTPSVCRVSRCHSAGVSLTGLDLLERAAPRDCNRRQAPGPGTIAELGVDVVPPAPGHLGGAHPASMLGPGVHPTEAEPAPDDRGPGTLCD